MNATTHIELPGSRRPMKRGAIRVRDIDPHARVDVTVTLKGPDLPSADDVPKAALGTAELEKRFGVPVETVRHVEGVLRGYGLSVEDVAQYGRSLRVSGPAAAIEAAFQPNLAIYHSAAQGEYRGRHGPLMIPSELKGIVTGVLGLDQRQVAKRKGLPAQIMAASPALSPSDLETRYRFPANDCKGQTVAIAEFGEPLTSGGMLSPAYFPNDVVKFCEDHNRPPPDVEIIPVNVSPLSYDQYRHLPPDQQQDVLDITGEVMMDVEIVAALAPAAKITVYFASFDQKGWVDLLDDVTAGKTGAGVGTVPVALSVSWGLAEDSTDWSNGAIDAISERLQLASMRGITVCVASGDDGTGDGIADRRAHVDFPASSPFVLGVGGTMLAETTEVVWWQAPGRRLPHGGGGATGGGVSARIPRPSWQDVQVASINPVPFNGRVVPDVSALAGPPFYQLIFLGEASPNGGTSASAPLWASLIARMNAALPPKKRQRFLTPLLYAKGPDSKSIGGAGCRDVTSGQNASNPQPGKGYSAKAGYDATTGWGTPDGTQLLHLLETV